MGIYVLSFAPSELLCHLHFLIFASSSLLFYLCFLIFAPSSLIILYQILLRCLRMIVSKHGLIGTNIWHIALLGVDFRLSGQYKQII